MISDNFGEFFLYVPVFKLLILLLTQFFSKTSTTTKITVTQQAEMINKAYSSKLPGGLMKFPGKETT